MKAETRMLLKLIMAAEEESEAGQQKTSSKKPGRNSQPNADIVPDLKDYAAMLEENKPSSKLTNIEKDMRKADLERTRKELYPDHTDNRTEITNVPIWAKYALTVPEAAEYFHLGYNKLREIVRRDKYAEYLLWNGGRVYNKRKLFDEYLNKETEV